MNIDETSNILDVTAGDQIARVSFVPAWRLRVCLGNGLVLSPQGILNSEQTETSLWRITLSDTNNIKVGPWPAATDESHKRGQRYI